jgi:hypothetical protein
MIKRNEVVTSRDDAAIIVSQMHLEKKKVNQTKLADYIYFDTTHLSYQFLGTLANIKVFRLNKSLDTTHRRCLSCLWVTTTTFHLSLLIMSSFDKDRPMVMASRLTWKIDKVLVVLV